jgi:hypothetical protein
MGGVNYKTWLIRWVFENVCLLVNESAGLLTLAVSRWYVILKNAYSVGDVFGFVLRFRGFTI